MASSACLQGACACGRNQYLIVIPPDSSTRTAVQVVFDDSSDNRRAHSSALPTLLRIPLPWLRSTTYAFYPDETHADIRRAFAPRYAPRTKRHFCGFCGTPLTSWSEETRDEAEWISINLHSLRSQSLDALWDMGVLPSVGDDGEEEEPLEGTIVHSSGSGDVIEQPWFEEMIEGSALGRLRSKRDVKTNADGMSLVEWEVVEFEERSDALEGSGTPGKRKIGEVDDDVAMRGGH